MDPCPSKASKKFPGNKDWSSGTPEGVIDVLHKACTSRLLLLSEKRKLCMHKQARLPIQGQGLTLALGRGLQRRLLPLGLPLPAEQGQPHQLELQLVLHTLPLTVWSRLRLAPARAGTVADCVHWPILHSTDTRTVRPVKNLL
jgi:hypothetical protein